MFDTWAYCLLNNHAHFIVKIKSVDAVLKSINERDQTIQTVAMKKLLTAPGAVEVFDAMAERQCNSFMVSYANYIKNKYQHHGGLFQSPFKRKVIDKDTYLQMAIIYVHANPLKHTISGDYKKYPYSSYDAILKNNSVNCAAAEVLLFFAGVDQYVLLHEEQVKYYYATGFPNSKLE